MIRVGVGGWVYQPWRGAFHRPGLMQAKNVFRVHLSIAVVAASSPLADV